MKGLIDIITESINAVDEKVTHSSRQTDISIASLQAELEYQSCLMELQNGLT